MRIVVVAIRDIQGKSPTVGAGGLQPLAAIVAVTGDVHFDLGNAGTVVGVRGLAADDERALPCNNRAVFVSQQLRGRLIDIDPEGQFTIRRDRTAAWIRRGEGEGRPGIAID